MKITLALLVLLTCGAGIPPQRHNIVHASNSQKGGAAAGVQVIEFGGTDARIDGFSFASGTDYTIVGWIYLQATSDAFGSVLTAGTSQGFWVDGTDRKLNMYVSGNQKNNTALTHDTWYHFAITVAGNSGTFYLNGASDGTFTGFQNTFTTINSASFKFKGRLSQLCVHSVVLNGTQISNLANKSTTSAAIGSRLAHWKLDEVANGASGASVSFADDSGNGETGTGAGDLTGRIGTY